VLSACPLNCLMGKALSIDQWQRIAYGAIKKTEENG
jgi:hypothetical protein